MLADIMGVSRAATDSKALLAKAAAERCNDAEAEVADIAAKDPVIGESGCFSQKVQMAFGRGDAGELARTQAARAEAFDAAVSDGYALLAAATGGDSGGASS